MNPSHPSSPLQASPLSRDPKSPPVVSRVAVLPRTTGNKRTRERPAAPFTFAPASDLTRHQAQLVQAPTQAGDPARTRVNVSSQSTTRPASPCRLGRPGRHAGPGPDRRRRAWVLPGTRPSGTPTGTALFPD